LSLFALTEDQLEFGAMTKQFCDKRIRPVARKLDNEGLSKEFLAELGELGYLGCSIPEDYGGGGIDIFSLAVMTEEFAKASGGVATLVAAHLGLGCKSVEMYGNDKQKATYLPRMARGEIASFCLTEPNAGTDVFSIEAKAQAQDDTYILNGEKHFITSADIAILRRLLQNGKRPLGLYRRTRRRRLDRRIARKETGPKSLECLQRSFSGRKSTGGKRPRPDGQGSPNRPQRP